MKVALDVFGGDNAPAAAIKGALKAKEEFGIESILCGNKEKIKEAAKENNIDITGFEIADAENVIEIEDDPTEIIKSKNNCSMAVALKAVAENKAAAAVSAGSTGALVIGGTFIVKRIKGIKRCALAAIIPSLKNHFLLLDVGANAEVKPEFLMQFGVMGSVYAEKVMGIKNPKVKLLNIGEEDCKGTEVHKEAYKLLKQANINFLGNAEGRDIMSGNQDVLISDGFSGNIALKTIEGVSGSLFSMLKGVFYKNTATKLAALTLNGGLRELKHKTDYTAIGGAPLLGTKAPVFKAHGSSNEIAFKNAIYNAYIFAKNGVIKEIEENL